MAGDVDGVRQLAIAAAQGAGALLLESQPTGQSSKSSPTDLVTDADRMAEEFIVEKIRTARPKDSILAEEGSLVEGSSGVRWVIDPLDGTINFVYGVPQWSVSIGVEGKVRVGVVHDPTRGETFTDGGDLRPSRKTDLPDALIGTGFSYSAEIRRRQAGVLARVLPNVRDVRRPGSCALDLAWVACGRYDGFYEEDTHEWDVSAGIAIIESAGAVVERIGTLTIAAGTKELFEKLKGLVLDHADD